MNTCMGGSNRVGNMGDEEDLENEQEIQSTFYIYSIAKEVKSGDGVPWETWQEARFSLRHTGDLKAKTTLREDNLKFDLCKFDFERSLVGSQAKNAQKHVQCDLRMKDSNARIMIPNKNPGKSNLVSNDLWLNFPTKKGLMTFIEFCKTMFDISGFLDNNSNAEVRRLEQDVASGYSGSESERSLVD